MHFPRPVRSRSQVQIIPMIDVLIFLLIFLIISTQFTKPRPALRIELPTVREVPSDKLADVRSVISVDAEGHITLDSLQVPEGLLQSYLAAYQKQNPGRKLELEADRQLSIEHLLGIWDSLIKAGIPPKDVPARIRLPE
ncbi:MAG: biopolymer transporter ExbD [Verrucomicrobiota bacterium]